MFKEIIQRRHIIVHTDGRISRRYLQYVSPELVQKYIGEEAKRGQTTRLDRDYVEAALDHLVRALAILTKSDDRFIAYRLADTAVTGAEAKANPFGGCRRVVPVEDIASEERANGLGKSRHRTRCPLSSSTARRRNLGTSRRPSNTLMSNASN